MSPQFVIYLDYADIKPRLVIAGLSRFPHRNRSPIDLRWLVARPGWGLVVVELGMRRGDDGRPVSGHRSV